MTWVLKTSAVRVAKREQEATFRSLKEIPVELKREMKKALEGPESETIFIANRAAYKRMEEITRRTYGAAAEAHRLRRGRRLFWAAAGAALSSATLTWIILRLFDR